MECMVILQAEMHPEEWLSNRLTSVRPLIHPMTKHQITFPPRNAYTRGPASRQIGGFETRRNVCQSILFISIRTDGGWPPLTSENMKGVFDSSPLYFRFNLLNLQVGSSTSQTNILSVASWLKMMLSRSTTLHYRICICVLLVPIMEFLW